MPAAIEYGARVVAVDPVRRVVVATDGRVFPYTELISTLPLPALLSP